MSKLLLGIDFDGVVHNHLDPVPGRTMGPPMEGAKEALQILRRAGHTLVIFTVRGDNPRHVEDWLNYYQIPYDTVTNIKLNFDLIIDDKAERFDNWDDLLDWLETE